MRAAQLQARGLLFTPVPSGPAARGGAKAVGSGTTASVSYNSIAPAGARGQHAMANQQVRFRPRRHRRKTLQQLQRLEHQLARAVVPRMLQLKRDATVAPQPQAFLREGWAQVICTTG